MSNNFKYSIVIPAYNCSLTICETLTSVLNQTRFDLIDEIIIVNDGSSDNTVSVIKEFSKKNNCDRIRIINKANGGAATARNVGIKESNNRFIALLDSDDIWFPNKIEIQNNILINT